MISNIGPMEIGVLLVVAVLVFGPKRLPEVGRSLGRGVRGFGQALKGDDEPAAAITPPEPAETREQS